MYTLITFIMFSTDLTHSHTGRGCLEFVKEELKVTDDNKLAHPALLDAALLWDLDVALVRGANAARGIDAEGPFRWKNDQTCYV
jgi:hypothetical protein